jgi:protoporphyrinogen oxidase
MVRKRKNAASGLRYAASGKTARGTHAFAGGMQTLLDALAEHLAPHIHYGVDASDLDPPSAQAPVLACLPAHAAANYAAQLPSGEALAKELRAVHYLPMISVTVYYAAGSLPDYRPGFGCLIPAEENFRILGVLHNHGIFEGRLAGEAAYSLTAILRDEDAHGHAGPWRDRTDAALITAVAEDIARLYAGAKQPAPLHAAVHRWPQGIPLYSPALSAAWPRMDQRLRDAHPGLALFGNYTGQIALRGMAEAARTAFGPPL